MLTRIKDLGYLDLSKIVHISEKCVTPRYNVLSYKMYVDGVKEIFYIDDEILDEILKLKGLES